jgi:hypothetical protein
MSTRSSIAVKHGTNVKAIYCHWDGYLSHNGKILLEHYNSVKANNLVAFGDVSSLGSMIGEAHPFSKFEINQDDPKYLELVALYEMAEKESWTTFYGRDRGEPGVEFRTYMSEKEWIEKDGQEYNYLLDDGVWYVSVGESTTFTPLHQAIEQEEEAENE